MYDQFERHDLDGQHAFYPGKLPADLAVDAGGFEQLWSMHPDEYHDIRMHGRTVKTPRWQQSYGRNYEYTGRVNEALPVSPLLEPYLVWARESIHERLNGLLLNWYDGELGHYIGAHHDSKKDLIVDAPIVTISLGEERTFWLTLPKTKTRLDFPAADGTVFVMPYDTNLAWKHEVTKSARRRGRRISITLRAFES